MVVACDDVVEQCAGHECHGCGDRHDGSDVTDEHGATASDGSADSNDRVDWSTGKRCYCDASLGRRAEQHDQQCRTPHSGANGRHFEQLVRPNTEEAQHTGQAQAPVVVN